MVVRLIWVGGGNHGFPPPNAFFGEKNQKQSKLAWV